MPGCARWEVVREGEIGTYHCWSRCVQRAYLCGQDDYTGADFSYRRHWIEALLEYQAGVFAVDVANYSVLSNHMHHIVRTRPDIVETWSDEEVAYRWKMAWPEWNGSEWRRQPTDAQILELLSNEKKMELARVGLSSVSWFMARCKEPIAKLCNAEMRTKGHFWEQRFGAREIADEGALLTCMVYVDLNQIKAGMASSLEATTCSGMATRLDAWRLREAKASFDEFHAVRTGEFDLSVEQLGDIFADAWLAPIADDGPLMTETLLASQQVAESTLDSSDSGLVSDVERNESLDHSASSRTVVSEATENKEAFPTAAPSVDALNRSIYLKYIGAGRRRASDNPILSMPFRQYREIVEWVVEQTVTSAISAPTVPEWLDGYLANRVADPERWFSAVDRFETWFGRAVGATDRLQQLLERTGNRWIRGIRNCRATFS